MEHRNTDCCDQHDILLEVITNLLNISTYLFVRRTLILLLAGFKNNIILQGIQQ